MPTAWQKLHSLERPSPPDGDLARCQQAWLMECLRSNENCRYGIEHGFSGIETISQFQARVPLVTYDDIQPYIADMEAGERDCLFAGYTLAFERTSGTGGGQKLLPYSSRSLRDFRRAVLPWLIDLAAQYEIETGCAYWAISPATRQPETTSAGLPVGLPEAAYLGEDLVPFFTAVSAVPGWVGEIDSIGDWQLATLYYLVCRDDLRLVSVWSPTFLVSLLEALADRREELESVLRGSTRINGHKLAADRLAHARLGEFYARGNPAILWPQLEVISCWADATSKPYADILRQRFGDTPIQPKGLLATEGVVSVPNRLGQSLLSTSSGFYEFIDEQQNICLAQELESGAAYEVVITTAGGLYRYQTSDRVVCDGYQSGQPVIRFIGRELTSDMVGEKLTEIFITACLEDISGFRMLMPNPDSSAGYTLLLENRADADFLAACIESRLVRNPQYAYARKLGQLKPLAVSHLDNPLKVYLDSPRHAGTCLGAIKLPSLCLEPSIFGTYLGATG